MRRRIRLRKLVTINWQAKLICLAAAVVVWLMVNHLLVRGGSTEWNIDDIRLSMPE